MISIIEYHKQMMLNKDHALTLTEIETALQNPDMISQFPVKKEEIAIAIAGKGKTSGIRTCSCLGSEKACQLKSTSQVLFQA
jgi:hypothetical protein